MGQGNTKSGSLFSPADETIKIIKELSIGTLVQNQNTMAIKFLKQYSFSSQQDYQHQYIRFLQKMSAKNQYVLALEDVRTKAQNTFCSTFYKIGLVYEYVQYTLKQQIQTRIAQERSFNERQIWSILCSCVLAVAHLLKIQSYSHSALLPRDIKLTQQGVVKILPIQMVGMENYQKMEPAKSSMLAATIVSCLTLQEQPQLLTQLPQLNCSQQMKNIIELMIKDTDFHDLEEQLYKLVQDDEGMSISSHANTPIIKTHGKKLKNKLQSRNMSTPKITIQRDDDTHIIKQNFLSFMEEDKPDFPSVLSTLPELQNEIPDQNDEQEDKSNLNTCRESELFSKTSRQNQHNYPNNININPMMHQRNNKILKQSQSSNYRTEEGKSSELFTNPVLLSQIKQDLQQIKMRKSQQKNFISKINENNSKNYETIKQTSQQNSKSYKTSQRTSNRQNEQNYNYLQLKVNPQYRKQNTQKYLPQRNQQKEQSIWQNTSMGFHKKNQYKEQKQPFESLLNQNNYRIQYKEKKYQQESKKRITQQDKDQQKNIIEPIQHQINIYHKNSKTIPLYDKPDKLQYARQNYSRGKYQGTKLNGMRHGHGTFYYSEGGKYVGDWSQNRMHGHGILYYPNKQVAYEGKWLFDQLSGYGVLYNEQVSQLRGPYDYRDWTNVQDYWIKYEGQFLKDNKNGKGKLFISNGQIFEGSFINDQIQGQGVLYRKDSTQVRGVWKKNKLVRIF